VDAQQYASNRYKHEESGPSTYTRAKRKKGNSIPKLIGWPKKGLVASIIGEARGLCGVFSREITEGKDKKVGRK